MTLFTETDKIGPPDRVGNAEAILNDYRDALGWPRQGSDADPDATADTAPAAAPDRLTVLRLEDGGYLVYFERGGQQVVAFAATTVDEACDYVTDRLGPVEPHDAALAPAPL